MENNLEPQIEVGNKKNIISEFINMLKQAVISKEMLVVDRFEGEYAVCEERESGRILNIEISKLPENIGEGDVVKFQDGKYEIDEEAKEEIEDRINRKFNNLFEEDNKDN